MNVKDYFIVSIFIIGWSAICAFGGYLFSNTRAIEQLEQAHQQLAELKQEYDTAIATAREQTELANQQLRDITNKLSQQVQNDGRTTKELSKLIEQIQKQKLNI